MKKIFTLVATLVSLVLATNAQSTTANMHIHKIDGSVLTLPVAEVDSICFSEEGGEEPVQHPELIWSSLELFGLEDAPISDKTYTVELSSFTATCQLHIGTYYLLGDGLYVGTDNYLHGAGYIAVLEMPTYVITAPAQYAGYYVSVSEYIIGSGEDSHWADSVGGALGGSIINFQDYATFLDQFYLTGNLTQSSPDFATIYQNYLASIEGAFIFQYDADNEKQGLDEAMIKGGEIISYDFDGDEVDELQYILEIEWLDDFYGLELNADGTDVVRPYNFVSTTVECSDLSYLGAPRAKQAKRLQTQKPEMKELKAFKAPLKANPADIQVKK